MNKYGVFLRDQKWLIITSVLAVIILCWLMFYRLGSLSGGLSIEEQRAAVMPYGWHGIYHQSFYLPLSIVRSIIFKLAGHHGQTLTRLPNALFGAMTIVCFGWLLWLWHGTRIAIFGSILFASSAWTLHVSRLASYDVLYLWATVLLILSNQLLHRYKTNPVVFYVTLLLWGLLLYIPGFVWFLALIIFWQRKDLQVSWQHFKIWWQRVLAIMAVAIWLPLLIHGLLKASNFKTWLGLPATLAHPMTLLKQFVAVPIHLFVRGPEYPQVWLGRAPILDVFTLIVTLLGIYFYVMHYYANRSQLLGCYFVIGWLLISLSGPVSLSVLLPILYVCAAAGITYLLREWLRVFPSNPLARNLGLGLIVMAISLSTLYNMRAYFVAWPNNPTTQATFRYHRK